MKVPMLEGALYVTQTYSSLPATDIYGRTFMMGSRLMG